MVLISAVSVSCINDNKGGHTHDAVGGHSEYNDHGHEAQSLRYTLYSGDYELFVEFAALTVGQTSSFAAHLTQLSNYKPVLDGRLTVSIVKGLKGIKHSVDAPSSPGIFRPALQPKDPGTYKLNFAWVSSAGNVAFEIPQIQVYANADEAAHASQDEAGVNEITFLKEQAWKTKFATQEVVLKPFYSIIHTSAKVNVQPQSFQIVNAQAEGQISLFSVVGKSVKKGELLGTIAGSGIENNINIKLKESKIAFEKSKSDYLRTKPLVAKQVVSRKDFLQIEFQYKQDSLHYFQMANQVSQNGLKITAPIDGFVSRINVSNGEFVNNGSVILSIVSGNRILIEAFVNQSDFKKVSGIFDANFTFGEEKESITLADLDGKITSNTAFVNENDKRISVSFSGLNNGKLMPGMFLEAYLKTGLKDSAIVIPLSAIIEEQGQYYVFVQTGGESFIKRQVNIGNNDGISIEIDSGLSAGERIVTLGAYQIKLAAMTSALPLHGHTH